MGGEGHGQIAIGCQTYCPTKFPSPLIGTWHTRQALTTGAITPVDPVGRLGPDTGVDLALRAWPRGHSAKFSLSPPPPRGGEMAIGATPWAGPQGAAKNWGNLAKYRGLLDNVPEQCCNLVENEKGRG